ncbi:MAG: transglycosylase domain-containing protein, partial [Ktedonobacterales bacterium]|nr:transglycosylase domain-containing protein [Ktedonobacterales bacterium]
DTPSRGGRRPAGDEYGQRSGTPSRPRSGDTPARGRSYDDAGDRSATPSRSRRSDGAAPRDAGRSGGARDAMRRVRDGFTGTFESMRPGRRGADDRAGAPPRRPRDEGYGRSAEWDDAPDRGYGDDERAPRRAAGSPPASLNDRDGASRSMARRLIERRRRVREGGMPPGQRAFITTVTTVVALIIILGGGFGVGYAYADSAKYNSTLMQLGLSQDLRSSRIYDRHGTLLYQTLGQNSDHRFYLNYCQLPDVIKWATIDTEDHNFWSETTGIDPVGILRAITVNLNKSGDTQGGSTITQQLVKLAVLGPKRTIDRKIDEAILAVNVSRIYSRQDVLTMYLNIVPYGYNNDGIEAAAIAYFHLKPIDIRLNQPIDPKYQKYVTQYQQCAKDQGIKINNNMITLSAAWQLEPWQATLLAGVPNNPNTYNPFLNPKTSTERQRDGVLIQMEKYGHGNFLTKPDGTGGEIPSNKDDLYNYTLGQIYFPDNPPTGVTPPKNYVRHIYANPYQGTGGIQELAPYFVEYVIQQLSKYFVDGREGFATAGWNVYTTLDYGKTVSDKNLARLHIDVATGKLDADNYNPKIEGDWISDVGLQQYADYLTRRDITQDFQDYWYCKTNFAHPDPAKGPFHSISENPFADNQNWCWETPLNNKDTNLNNGALTAIDPRNGDILAMVGGVDYYGKGNIALDGGPYNVTLSEQRSMGSSFKPISYATAFEMGWNPGTIAADQPTCFPAEASTENGSADDFLCPKHYLAHNYSGSNWAGPQPITYLLGNSLNTPAELSLSFTGMRASATDPAPMITMARRLGISSKKLDPLQVGPSAAIGTLPVPLLQLTSAYGTFADNGYHQNPRTILQVTQPDGSPVYDHKGQVLFPYVAQPKGYQAISPQSAYMLTSILTNNSARTTDFGRSNPLHFPGRDVAAKTGTSDSKRDIVTMGYTPWLALGVWAGNNDNSSAGNEVIGIAGAGYIFHDVMAFAINRMGMPGPLPSRFSPPAPGGYFAVPQGLHRAVLNCHTGLAPWNGQDVNDPKSACNPSKLDRVPDALSTEFSFCTKPGKEQTVHPNETLNCFGDPAKNKIFDSWQCMGWGCNNGQGGNDPGQDIAWIPDNQDPTVP